MKVHKVVLMVIDHEDLGEDAVKQAIENAHFANDCLTPEVASVETREVEWSDNHQLNLIPEWQAAFAALFEREEA